ncbi:divalent-cation tolerance protein CutA [candidate division WOR-3 bacterium]|nr:divalent-cation tolerance protein CutA [candidate division WOR-3 bacterium]
MEEFCIVYSTFPKRKKARQIAKELINDKLIACANIFKIDALYRWKGELEEAHEYAVFFKTRKSLYGKVEKRIKEYHPYDCPAIIQIPINRGYEGYLRWIENETIEEK